MAAAPATVGTTTLPFIPVVQLLGRSQFLKDWSDLRETDDADVVSVVPEAATAPETSEDGVGGISVSEVTDRFNSCC